MGKITPRWEYRIFGDNLDPVADRLADHECTRVMESDEVYLLSRLNGINMKIRNGLLDIKILQAISSDNLEQWLPLLKMEFPAPATEVARVFEIISLPPPTLTAASYGHVQFLKQVALPCADLVTVAVSKRRDGYLIRDCIVEIADLTFDGQPIRTAAAEHTDPELVLDIARELGIAVHPNTNYIRAMKNALGMEGS